MAIEQIIAEAPDNFVIQNALIKAYEVVQSHNNICIGVSGGGDSDVMLDMLVRVGAKDKSHFVFFDTGLEYAATKEHINYLQDKYGINIETVKAKKSIPTSIKQYGMPFWSKYASDMLSRLQRHGFKFEDEPFEVLIEKYPSCKTALVWWCNQSKGTQLFTIDRSPYLKEFLIDNKPSFKISNMCCNYAKKNPSHEYCKEHNIDLMCLGIRKIEGGVRAGAYKNCYSESREYNFDSFRPIFWLSDADKEQYCSHYGVVHSKCYTEYGLKRTGCFGCPFGKRFEEELESIEKFEPKLVKAANAIFKDSYDYTRKFIEFRNEMKERDIYNNRTNHCGCSEQLCDSECVD